MAISHFPIGLTASMFVAVVTIGVQVAAWNLGWPGEPGFPLIVHVAAGTCLFWAVVSLLLHSLTTARADHKRQPAPNTSLTTDASHEIQAVLNMVMIVTGLIVVILMVYTAMTEALWRTPYLISYDTPWRVNIWRFGFLDLGFVIAAVIITWGHTREPQLIPVCFWLLILVGLWLALRTPGIRPVYVDGNRYYTEPTGWAVPFLVTSTLTMAAFVIAEGIRHFVRRQRAWPDHLHDLVNRPPVWPGFDYSIGVVSVALLLLGCIHILSLWTTFSMFVGGAALLTVVARRWDESLADLALGLLTVGIVSLPLALLGEPNHATAAYFAEVFNRTVLGLAIATFFWHWLALFWEQQLDHGEAWTTAGQLIRNVKRIGFLCGATGVLVGFHLAFWPRFPEVRDLDASAWRWGFGLTAYALLTLSLIVATRRTSKTTLGFLTLLALTAGVSFSLMRLGGAPAAEWWYQHWPITMPGLAIAAILLALAINGQSAWQPYIVPLQTLGTLAAPAAAVLGISMAAPLTQPAWLGWATWLGLSLVYAVIAMVYRSAMFLVLVAITVGAALLNLR